jgi:hypothetical protein
MFRRIACVLAAMVLLTGCEKSREINGKTIECIGLDDSPQSGVTYEVSTRNVVVDIIFVETLIVPIWSVLEDVKCPERP